MKFNRLVPGLVLGLMLVAGPAFAQIDVQPLNIDGIAKAMGKEGDLIGEMYRVSFPRSDLTVKVGNVVIKPALALMSWAAFVKSGSTAISYGDLVLLDDEINPVISKLEEREVSSYPPSITISCMRILGSCTSTSSVAATRWRWRRGFGRHWRSPNRP
jgi:Domain of Unknown Function (DUF1259)